MAQTSNIVSNFTNGSSPSDIVRLLDLLRSSKHHALSPSSRGINKKRTLHQIYDDSEVPIAFEMNTIPPLTEPPRSPGPSSPIVDVLQSLPSKKSRQDEVPTSTQGAGADTKVLPSSVGLSTFAPEDVLSGRGGGTNQHEGNCFFRSLINSHREKYLRSKKNDKPFISRSIVNAIRRRNGRFLKKDEKAGLWYEIGDAAAREKTSQALRQRAPEYRRQIYEKDCQAIRQQHQPTPTLASPLITPPLSPHVMSSTSTTEPLGNISSPVNPLSPYRNLKKDTYDNDAVFQMYSATLRQAHLQEQAQQEALRSRLEQEKAQEALRLEQKLRAVKMLEILTLMGNGTV